MVGGEIYPTRSGCQMVSARQQDETVDPEQVFFGRCPSPRTGTRAQRAQTEAFPSAWRGIHRNRPPCAVGLVHRTRAPKKIASKQLNAVTPRTRASGAQKPARVKRRTLRLFEVCGEGPPPQHDSIAQPVIGETSYYAPPPRQTLLPAHISLSHLV